MSSPLYFLYNFYNFIIVYMRLQYYYKLDMFAEDNIEYIDNIELP